ncbi:hypothetical protein OK016_20345 [Vibrio chagasii]|nr:hypothetical protein [Vibrio chagasii]
MKPEARISSTTIDSLDDAKDAINYWVERLGGILLQNIDDLQKD